MGDPRQYTTYTEVTLKTLHNSQLHAILNHYFILKQKCTNACNLHISIFIFPLIKFLSTLLSLSLSYTTYTPDYGYHHQVSLFLSH